MVIDTFPLDAHITSEKFSGGQGFHLQPPGPPITYPQRLAGGLVPRIWGAVVTLPGALKLSYLPIMGSLGLVTNACDEELDRNPNDPD